MTLAHSPPSSSVRKNAHPSPPPSSSPMSPLRSSSPTLVASSIESTYTSLIQQYLSLLQYDNAIFIAERFVSYNSTPYSNYLLAMCYYRSHRVQYAKRVLTNWCQKNPVILSSQRGSMSTRFFDGRNQNSASGSANSDFHHSTIIGENIIYLLAKCCIDLELWKEAEDVLLKTVRVEYVQYKKKYKEEMNKERKNQIIKSNGDNGNRKNQKPDIGPMANNLEEFLLEFFSTTSGTSANSKNKAKRSSQLYQQQGENENCPIPNGAAGLHLMGVICQRTMRKEKASIYYQLALKLDPMMWTSYEALCEMGIATVQSRPELDPSSIFGVIPPNLLSIPKSQGGYGAEISTTAGEAGDSHQYNNEHYTNTGDNKKIQGKSLENQEFLRRVREIGSESYSPFNTMNASPIMAADGDFHTTSHISTVGASSSFVPQTPYAQNGTTHGDSLDRDNSTAHSTSFFPHTANSKTSSGIGGGHLPSTTLFATPGLTPIPHHQQPHEYLNYSSAKKDEVFSRAKLVASRLYYEPSPELTPPSYYQNPLRKKFMSNIPDAHTPPASRFTPPSSVNSSLKTTRRKQYRRRTDLLLSVDERKQGDFGEQRLLFDGMQGNGGNSDEDMVGGEDEEATLLGEVENIDKGTSNQTGHTASGGKHRNDNREGEEGVGEEGIQYILELFCTLGAAQRMLCSYHCKEAIHILRSLPNNQYNTGFVQHQVGRAYFEMADYPSAQRALETMQRVEPHRMKGLELLSTVFWHLKREVELSSLAQRAVDFDRMAPESWCVVGNCFSLQKEHETALAFFRRSIQCDPSFTYSYTLSGHEYASNEDFDQALACFRNAIRNDDRHYTAWYGLGAIYFRQDKYDLAEYHFKKALSINPQSSVLHCHLGMAQHENGRNEEALDTLACAFRVDPRNPQARFQRATIWISMDRPDEALKELEKVRDAAPREASVHFAMGKVLKRLGRPEEAMRCFLTALDLDPKDNNLIKAAIDRLDDPDVLEEDNPAF